jgi:hypothetical protein
VKKGKGLQVMGCRDRLLYGFLLSFFCPFLALAQYTTVTGTVTDVNGLAYSGGQMKAQLVLNGGAVTGQPTVTINNLAQCNAGGFGSAPCQIPFPGTIGPFALDANGNMPTGGVQFPNNSLVTPAGTQWLFTINETPGIPPPGGTGPQTCTATITITGGSQSVSTQLATCPALSKITGGGGAGCTPLGSNGDLQMKNGTACAPSHINDSGTALVYSELSQFNGDAQFSGLNPYVDIRGYGAYTTFSSTTCTTTSGQATVTLGSAASFKNGEYATCYNAGPAPAVSTPAAPTITPSVHAGGETATSNTSGSTSYAYELVAEDTNNGRTAASPAGTTANGQASLGLIGSTATGCTRSGKAVTCTVAVAAGFVPTMDIYIAGAVDSTFNGTWATTAGTTGTTVIFNSGFDTANGASTSTAFSGTAPNGFNVWGWVMNRITWPHDNNAFRHHIYGPNCPTTCNWLGQTIFDFYDDLGATMLSNQARPIYIPAAAPATSANQHFTFKILAGGGTGTLTASTNAGASVTNNGIVSDAGPAIVAAGQASQGSFNPVSEIFIPNVQTPAAGWQVNSYTDLSFLTRGAQIALNAETLTLNNTLANVGRIRGIGSGGIIGFSWGTMVSVTGNGYPLLYAVTQIRDVAVSVNVNNGGLGMFYPNATNTSYDHTYWSSCGAGCAGTTDYIGQSIVFQTVGSGSTGFQNNFNYATFSGGQGGADFPGSSPVPTVVFQSGASTGGAGMGANEFSNVWFQNRGSIDLDTPGAFGGSSIQLTNGWSQDANEPSIQISGGGSANVGSGIVLKDCLVADFPTPLLTVYGVALNGIVQLINTASGNNHAPLITGNPVTVFSTNSTSTLLLGTNNSGVNFQRDQVLWNSPEILGTNGALFSNQGSFAPAAPTCTVATAGPPFTTAGTWFFSYAPQFINGLGTTLGGLGVPSLPSASACTSDGSTQQITMHIPAAIPGAVGYQFYESNTQVSGGANGGTWGQASCNPENFLNPIDKGFCFGGGGVAYPSGGPLGISDSVLWTPDFSLVAAVAPTGTATTTHFYMDSTTNWPSFKPAGNTAYGFLGMAGSTAPAVQTKRVAGCATGAALGNTCDTTVTWTTSFPDTNYTVVCSGNGVTSGTPELVGVNVSGAQTAAAATVRTVNNSAAAAQFTLINCTAIHD